MLRENSAPWTKPIAALLLVLALSACTRDQIATSVLGGAKNWCRHSGGSVCHVNK